MCEIDGRKLWNQHKSNKQKVEPSKTDCKIKDQNDYGHCRSYYWHTAGSEKLHVV